MYKDYFAMLEHTNIPYFIPTNGRWTTAANMLWKRVRNISPGWPCCYWECNGSKIRSRTEVVFASQCVAVIDLLISSQAKYMIRPWPIDSVMDLGFEWSHWIFLPRWCWYSFTQTHMHTHTCLQSNAATDVRLRPYANPAHGRTTVSVVPDTLICLP